MYKFGWQQIVTLSKAHINWVLTIWRVFKASISKLIGLDSHWQSCADVLGNHLIPCWFSLARSDSLIVKRKLHITDSSWLEWDSLCFLINTKRWAVKWVLIQMSTPWNVTFTFKLRKRTTTQNINNSITIWYIWPWTPYLFSSCGVLFHCGLLTHHVNT